MTNPFVDWIKRSRSDKGETVSGRMVETRSQKTSEERKELLEIEVNTDHTMNDNQEVNGLEGRGRRLASESTPVEQDHDFATSTGTLDREEMSELSDISTEVTATKRSGYIFHLSLRPDCKPRNKAIGKICVQFTCRG